MSAMTITTENFDAEVLQSDRLVVIDFWAEWCGPCKMLSPAVDKLAEEYPDVKICKVNVDDCPELARKYNVMSIPNVLFIKGGKLLDSSLGVVPKEKLEKLIKKYAK